ncbi:NAD(P)-binding protein [Ramicandelaber brevisporus]|nr:NAD(P)-binding protein [Ramicandelaber brevisporus]
MPCKKVLAGTIATRYLGEIKKEVASLSTQPKLVGFLANSDPAAEMYSQWTGKSCDETGVAYELRKVEPEQLIDAIKAANADDAVHGILVYYPVFGPEKDIEVRTTVSPLKDVEGLCPLFAGNLYDNVRYLDNENQKKCILPCTPLAIVKILEHIGVYNPIIPYGDRLYGRTITVINRSRVVGHPLAALLANDGAKVYSVDIADIQQFYRGSGLKRDKHHVEPVDLTLAQVLAVSDVVISGVPTESYKIDSSLLKDGVIAINFSTFRNFQDNVVEKASLYIPTVGKVTVAMLQRNLVRLCKYATQQQ